MISNTVSMWVNIAGMVLSALAGATTQLTDIFGSGPAQKVVAGISLAGLVVTTINMALHAQSPASPGPLAPTPPAA